jgi:hypothetical protein
MLFLIVFSCLVKCVLVTDDLLHLVFGRHHIMQL